jgi:hypothetical protein
VNILKQASEKALYDYTAGSTAYEEEHFRKGFEAGAKWATAEAEKILATWHFTKGGYSEIAKRIADLAETE